MPYVRRKTETQIHSFIRSTNKEKRQGNSFGEREAAEMTITEIANEMKRFVGGSSFITRKKFAEFMGKRTLTALTNTYTG